MRRYTRRQVTLFHRQAIALEQAARADRIEDIAASMDKDPLARVKSLRKDP